MVTRTREFDICVQNRAFRNGGIFQLATLFHVATLCNSHHAEKVQSVVSTRSVTATKTPNIGQIERHIYMLSITNRWLALPLHLPSKTEKYLFHPVFSPLSVRWPHFLQVIYLTDSNLTSSPTAGKFIPFFRIFVSIAYLSQNFLCSIQIPVF